MTHAVVVGAGLSGLAAALMLARSGVAQVTVLETRASHTRDNHILLGHLGASRLRQLGVYDAWQEAFRHSGAVPSEGAITRGEGIEKLVRELKDRGRIPEDAPDDHVRFQFGSSKEEVIRACKNFGLEVDESSGVVTAFENATPEMVADFQQRALGIENVKITELEQTMVKLCHERVIKVIYKCGDVKLIMSAANDSVVEVHTSNGVRITSPSLVVDCEGARREIAKKQLKLREVRSSTSQWFAMFMVEKFYGPVAYTVINARDSDYSSARLRHFLVANFQTKQHSLFSTQLPPQFVGALDDDYNGNMLKQFFRRHLALVTSLHELEPLPEEFTVTWPPFESREMYLEGSCFGDNVIVVGDAARSGSFLSGTGYNLALVNDLNVIETLARHIVAHGRATHALIAEAGASIERTSKFFHQLNLERYC